MLPVPRSVSRAPDELYFSSEDSASSVAAGTPVLPVTGFRLIVGSAAGFGQIAATISFTSSFVLPAACARSPSTFYFNPLLALKLDQSRFNLRNSSRFFARRNGFVARSRPIVEAGRQP